MILTDQVYAQAMLLAGGLEKQQEQLLKVLVTGICGSLSARLRQGLTPDDCRADFIAAASLYALSALTEVKDAGETEQFTAGDITLRRRSADAASNCLRSQAELMIAPYLQDRFSFRGV